MTVRCDLASGARAGLPVVLGYLSIGFAAGVVQRASGLSVVEVMLMSLVLYAGSAQFVAASLIAAATPASAIFVTVFFVNVRHVLLSAALAPALARLPAWQTALIGTQLTDETFVIAWNRLANGGALGGAWMAGLNLSAYSAWATANLAGALVGQAVGNTRALGLDFALAAMFAALLVMQLAIQPVLARGLAVAAAAVLVTLAAVTSVPGHWIVIIATVTGATLGVLLERWKSDPTSS